MDLKKWNVFRHLDPAFVADVDRAYLVGIDSYHDEARASVLGKKPKSAWSGGVMVMKNGDVYSVALTSADFMLLGVSKSNALLPLVPVKVEAVCGLEIRDINSAHRRVALLTMDGHIYQWGNLSANFIPSISREPQLVLGALENQQVTQIACGDHHTLALTKEGDVYAWGMNYCGQLGLGNKDPQANPVKVPLPDVYYHKVAMLACGRWTSFALDVAGNVWSWGGNIGYIGTQLLPRQISLPDPLTITKIAAGNLHVLALTTQNEVYFLGQQATEQPTVTPTKVEICNVRDIATIRGCSVSSVETMEGKVYFWGFAYGHVIPEPVLTAFSSMDELFASLDSPMMLKPVQPEMQQPTVTERLGASFDYEQTADVKFRVEGKLIHAHKMFLKLRNDHFRRMFDNNWKENDEGAVVEISDLKYKDFYNFLFYLYTDRIHRGPCFFAEDVLELLKIADYYGEEDLKRRCGQQLKVLTTSENFGEIYSVAVQFNAETLEELTLEFAVQNLNAVMKTAGYKGMSDELKVRLMEELADRDVFVGLKKMRRK